jgi:hypothetical protein
MDDFVEAIKRHDQHTMTRTVYRQTTNLPGAGGQGALGGASGPSGQLLQLTYANPETNLLIVVQTLIGSPQEVGDIEHTLKQEGITVFTGSWLEQGMSAATQGAQGPTVSAGPDGQFWVAAVAYNSADDEPGVWMEAFPTQPEEDEVLHAMFDEFVTSGDLADASYEDFVSDAAPTVQIVAARDIQQWLRKRA